LIQSYHHACLQAGVCVCVPAMMVRLCACMIHIWGRLGAVVSKQASGKLVARPGAVLVNGAGTA